MDVRDSAQRNSAVRVAQGHQSGFAEAVSKQAKENCASKKAKDEEQRALRDATSLDSTSLSQSILSCSKTLREMRGCQWLGMRHTCPTLVAATTASDARPESSVVQLAHDWQKRHLGLPESPPTRARTRPQPACYREGTCTCGAGRRFHREIMQRCQKNIQEFLQNKGLSDFLIEGKIILAWIRTPIDNEEEAAVEPHVIWSYVALHYKKPWRPTMILLKLLQELDHQTSLRRLLNDACDNEAFTFEIVTEDKGGVSNVPALRTWRHFVLDMNVDSRWALRFLSLSDRNRVSLMPVGRVTALTLDTEATPVWNGVGVAGDAAEDLLNFLLPVGAEQGYVDNNNEDEDVQSNGSGHISEEDRQRNHIGTDDAFLAILSWDLGFVTVCCAGQI